jgi:hypothetical protein
MKRINCKQKSDSVYIEFLDYKSKDQLKDFYKLFKKGSGYQVLEYKEIDDCIKAMTSNTANTATIEWNPEFGCCVFANKKDYLALLGITYKMLCYRYKIFSKYSSMFDGILIIENSSRNENMSDDNPDYANDEIETINDIKELLSILK